MQLWRLTRSAFQELDGEGARLYGGRWDSEGRAVVYLPSTLALAALEYLVHIDIVDAPTDLVALELDVPDRVRVEEVDAEDLPVGWREVADHPACLAHGDAWVDDGASALLRVPSAVVPREFNYLLNPLHADAAHVRVVASEPFAFEPRLVR